MNEWISISNSLPKIGERVLVRRENGDAHTSHLQFVDDEGQYYDATHWMPLPELLEEE